VRAQNKKLLKPNKWTPYLLISPVVALIAVFLFYPVINIFWYSLFRYNFAKPRVNGFAGLENFVNVFTQDTIFWGSLWVSIKWVAYTVSLQLLFGMLLALALYRKFRGQGAVRTILFSPWAVSGILVSMLWVLLTNENMGFINSFMMDIGLWQKGIAWTGNVKTVFAAIVSAEVWRGLPFFIIILLAALQSIPLEMFDSARVDGANSFRIFYSITLPYLKSTIVYSTLLRIIWEFNNVDVIYVITKGGPANRTLSLAMYTINQAIKAGEFGYGAALNVVSFVIMLVFILIYLKATKYGQGVE